MKIALKNIYLIPDLTCETVAYVADIYIDNVLAGGAGGMGGRMCTFYGGYFKKGCELIEKAENWCISTLPDIDLVTYIGMLLMEHVDRKDKERFRNKLNKDSRYGIAVGIPNEVYRIIYFSPSIRHLVSSKEGIARLKDNIYKYVLPAML